MEHQMIQIYILEKVIHIILITHPLLIKTVAGTGTGNQYTTGVSGSANGVIIFEVPMNAPSTLYYQCQFHGNMVGTINIS